MGDFIEIFINLFELGWRVMLLVLIVALLAYFVLGTVGLFVGGGLGAVIGLIWEYRYRKKIK